MNETHTIVVIEIVAVYFQRIAKWYFINSISVAS